LLDFDDVGRLFSEPFLFAHRFFKLFLRIFMIKVLAGISAALFVSSASAVTVFSEDFESWAVNKTVGYSAYFGTPVLNAPATISPSLYTAGNGWSLGGSVDTVFGGYGAINGTSIDLAGTPGPGTLYNTITGLTVGNSYTYSFNYAANGGSLAFTYNTSPGGHNSNNWMQLTGLNPTSSLPFQSYSTTFVAGSTTLAIGFSSITNANFGTGGYVASGTIDDVKLVTAVPEPGETAMLLAGLGVIGLIVRRRRA
jgi:hypothetical protein